MNYEEQFPYLVTGVKDGDKMQSVNYIDLIGLLTHEIQGLKCRMTEMEKQLQINK